MVLIYRDALPIVWRAENRTSNRHVCVNNNSVKLAFNFFMTIDHIHAPQNMYEHYI
jgi:hypothetical protein